MLSKPAELSQVWLTTPALQQRLISRQWQFIITELCHALLVDIKFRQHRKDATHTSVQVPAFVSCRPYNTIWS